MENVYIYRSRYTDQGTLGLFVAENFWVYSIELPYIDNKPNISCIPTGSYKCALRYSPHFKKNLYHVLNVPNRSYIMIHVANFAGNEAKKYKSNVQGCIGLGLKPGHVINKYDKPQLCVLNSAVAVNEMMTYFGGRDFMLHIKEINNGFFD